MTADTGTFQRLQQLRAKFGPGIFGKMAQKLLALAFYKAGFDHVVERGVQGVDIDVAMTHGAKYAFEVKTTSGDVVVLSQDNLEALSDRAKDGYSAAIAVLRMQMFEEWVFAAIPLRRLRPGPLTWGTLRAYHLDGLEAAVRPAFRRVVAQHFDGVLSGGEHYLSEALAQRRV